MDEAIETSGTTAIGDREIPAKRSEPDGMLLRLAAAIERNTFVVFVLAGCSAFLALTARGSIKSDGWLSLVAGRSISRVGIPHHDTLAVLTHGHRWVDQQWLAHLAIYGLWASVGWGLTLLSITLCIAIAFALTAKAARLLDASDRATALIAIPCFLAAMSNNALRAQIPAYVLFAAVLLLLLADEKRPSRRVFFVFPILMLWANVHGSVIFGAGLVALRGATAAIAALRGRVPAKQWLPGAASLITLPWLCTLVSPYGLALPAYYRSVLANSSLDEFITEWFPATVRSSPVFFGLLFGGLWLIYRQRGALGPFAQLAFIGSGFAGLLAVRNIVWFAFIAAATLPCALDAVWPPSVAPRRPRINLILVGVAIVAVAATSVTTVTHSRSWFESAYPNAAASMVAKAASSDPRLKVFATEQYGDWLLFKDPQLSGRVAYDGRLEILTERQFVTIGAFRLEQGLNWQRAADGYGLLVLNPVTDVGAVDLFKRKPGTLVLYHDRHVVVLRVASGGDTR